MKKLRTAFFIKPTSIIMALLTLHLSMYSCKKDKEYSDQTKGEERTFEGEVIEVKTGINGSYQLKTYINSQGEQFDLTYDLRIRDAAGKPVEGISISYNQINGKSLIYITDEQGRYVSTFFIGTPRELETFFGGTDSKEGPFIGDVLPSYDTQQKDSEAIITLTILAIITVASVSYASVGFILNAYKVQMFYLTDYVTHTEDYILYCKTFDQIADLIKARTNIVFNLASIFISYVAILGGGSALAIEIVNSGLTFGVEELRSELFNQAVSAWGYSMSHLAGRKVAVKVFPYEQDAIFSGARNLFATYTIEYENEACSDIGVISGTVIDATNGNVVSGAIVNISGPVVQTTSTNSEGKYSFENLGQGNYTVTVNKNNFITDSKSVQFDGSIAVVSFVLSPVLAPDEYRVVLTWGDKPADLDLHLTTANGDHIYWSNKGSLTQYPWIQLDFDVMSGYGPETITIGQLQASNIYVHNYSGTPDIKESQAQVRLFKGNQLIKEYSVPSSGSGRWWHVFEIDNHGIVVDQNFLFDLKKITGEAIKQ